MVFIQTTMAPRKMVTRSSSKMNGSPPTEPNRPAIPPKMRDLNEIKPVLPIAIRKYIPYIALVGFPAELIDSVKDVSKKACDRIGTGHIQLTVTRKTTHVVCYSKQRNMNLLRGLIRGLWIINYNWIVQSIKSDRWVKEDDYELEYYKNTSKRCRLQRKSFGPKFKMALFGARPETFFVDECGSSGSEYDIKELISDVGGRLKGQPRKASFIISDRFRPGLRVISSRWIIDCITKGQLLERKTYMLSNKEDETWMQRRLTI